MYESYRRFGEIKIQVMNELKIIGLGEIVWDRFRDYERLGGAPLNFAYFASQLGAEAYVISAVGKDEAGERTLAVIGEVNLKLTICRIDYTSV